MGLTGQRCAFKSCNLTGHPPGVIISHNQAESAQSNRGGGRCNQIYKFQRRGREGGSSDMLTSFKSGECFQSGGNFLFGYFPCQEGCDCYH